LPAARLFVAHAQVYNAPLGLKAQAMDTLKSLTGGGKK
jgi:hypothetical protein